MTTEESVLYLAYCAMNGETPDKEFVSAINPEEVLRFANRHRIGCCVAMALESAGIRNKETAKAITTAMRRNALFEASLKEVTGKLDEAGIRYVPLKGIILKGYYPKPFMREMTDHDIWVDAARAEDVKEIMEGLGFTTEKFGKRHHDIYHKKPVLNYEMHTVLFEAKHDPQMYEYYINKTDLSRPEDFYLYTIAHEYKHYSRNGTGLRSLLDVYLYLKEQSFDWDYVEKEAEKLGIREFERINRQLAIALFGKGTAANSAMADGAVAKDAVTDRAVENGLVDDDAMAEMLSNVLSAGGVYGTFAHRVNVGIKKSGGKRLRYMLKRFSVPMRSTNPDYKGFAARYPMFYKYRILLPLLPFYRIYNSMKEGRLSAEWKYIRKNHK